MFEKALKRGGSLNAFNYACLSVLPSIYRDEREQIHLGMF